MPLSNHIKCHTLLRDPIHPSARKWCSAKFVCKMLHTDDLKQAKSAL